MNYYLGLDQGTTGTTALLFDEQWREVSSAHLEHRQYYPFPGWVEHDADEILHCVLEAAGRALKGAGISASALACVGLANQGETVLLWDRETGEPVAPAIVWQDRRTSGWIDRLNAECGPLIRERTGLIPDAYFSASKIRWILDHVSGVREKEEQERILAGTLDAWIIWKLTGGKTFATDRSTASRTMLMNLRGGEWDDDILGVVGIPKEILPEIRNSSAFYGATDPSVFFGACVPITGNLTDQQAALFG